MGGASSRGQTSRFAAIDVGSNTIHLLIADSNGDIIVPVVDESTRLQLGADVVQHGAFLPEKMGMAVETVREYVERARLAKAKAICLLGTQAVRISPNGEELARRIEEATAVRFRVITPSAEAQLGYLGTTLDLPDARPRLVIDIGGGSTQLLFADGVGSTSFLGSLGVGSVVLPARFIRHDPPSKGERQRTELAIQQAIGMVDQRRDRAAEYGILIGGVGRRLRRAVRLEPGEPLVRLTVERLAKAAMTASSEAMETFGAVRLGDADMVRAGALVLSEVMGACNIQYCLVSDNGIREGAILSLARGEAVADGD